MNDREELVHGLRAAKDAIQQSSRFHGWNQSKLLPVLNDVVEDYLKTPPDVYVTCFGTDTDSLTHWRGYCEGQGVSIELSLAGLEQLTGEIGGEFQQVIYSKVGDHGQAATEIQARVDWLIERMGSFITNENQRRLLLAKVVRSAAAAFKHVGFKDETEWRYVYSEQPAPDFIQFRVRDNVLVPYFVLKGAGPLPITKVTVGPGKDQEFTRKSIERFLKASGYGIVPVIESNVPYRT
ncbi:DUF2971 domain-containing protein [Chitinolyticbacter albus]|uniref:DUF2971 domain-containing protein n=1 Tax=Chitinolyticbacter albus TaxID=2961951 RepID=UPI00210CD3C1|nr:DUF2971 domain-containing protein [Chitinolyticbacter albus]